MDASIQPRPSDVDREVRKLLSDILSNCRGSRARLAELLTDRSGRRISLSVLNAYCTTSSKTAHFPASLILPLAEITGDDRLQRFVMGPRLRSLVEFAERELRGHLDQREREALRDALLRDLPKGGKP